MSSTFAEAVAKTLSNMQVCKLCVIEKAQIKKLGLYGVSGLPFKVCEKHMHVILDRRGSRTMLREDSLKQPDMIIFPGEAISEEEKPKEETKEEEAKEEVRTFNPPLKYIFATSDLLNLFSVAKSMGFDERSGIGLSLLFYEDIKVRQLTANHTSLLEAVIEPSSSPYISEVKAVLPTDLVLKVLARRKVEDIKIEIPDEKHVSFIPDSNTMYTLNIMSVEDYEYFDGALALQQPVASARFYRKELAKAITGGKVDSITFTLGDDQIKIQNTFIEGNTEEVCFDVKSPELVSLNITEPVKATFSYDLICKPIKGLKCDFIDLKFYGTDKPMAIEQCINTKSHISVYSAPRIE
jgi:hypothetical protein